MEESPFLQPQAQQTFSNHFKRLQEIEQKVVRAIEAASFVMLELSKTREDVNKQLLHGAATAFVTQIQEAQQLVLQAIKSAAPERRFEANNYFPMVQAMVAAEKLDAVSVHVSGISKLLRQHRQHQQEPPDGPLQLPGDGAAGSSEPEEERSHSSDVGLGDAVIVSDGDDGSSGGDVMLVDGLGELQQSLGPEQPSLGPLAPPPEDEGLLGPGIG